jgi:hypothetical protein
VNSRLWAENCGGSFWNAAGDSSSCRLFSVAAGLPASRVFALPWRTNTLPARCSTSGPVAGCQPKWSPTALRSVRSKEATVLTKGLLQTETFELSRMRTPLSQVTKTLPVRRSAQEQAEPWASQGEGRFLQGGIRLRKLTGGVRAGRPFLLRNQ